MGDWQKIGPAIISMAGGPITQNRLISMLYECVNTCLHYSMRQKGCVHVRLVRRKSTPLTNCTTKLESKEIIATAVSELFHSIDAV
jgi:hypothetical protein